MAKGAKKSGGAIYKSFYPTSVGTDLPDVTFQKFPSYSMRVRPDPLGKKYSPGPAAYPNEESSQSKNKKYKYVAKSIFPEDKAHKYSMRIRGQEQTKVRTPGPAAYPFIDPNDTSKKAKTEIKSIYPKDHANEFSMRKKKDEKYNTAGPGPAAYVLRRRDDANKFTMCPKRDAKAKFYSPGPAQYPAREKDTKHPDIVQSIYPNETRLPATMKRNYDIKDRDRIPAPNAYPNIETNYNPKIFKSDVIQKMIPGKKQPAYSLGQRHSAKQQIMVLNEDEY